MNGNQQSINLYPRGVFARSVKKAVVRCVLGAVWDTVIITFTSCQVCVKSMCMHFWDNCEGWYEGWGCGGIGEVNLLNRLMTHLLGIIPVHHGVRWFACGTSSVL